MAGSMEDLTISIVTPAYNAGKQLPQLIESLRSQSDRDFEWVVADGGSQDETLDQLRAAGDIRLTLSSQPDFGIYDAMNRGIRLASGRYYVVVGADDTLDPDAVANFKREIERSGADIVAAKARYRDRIMQVKKGPVWLFGQFSLIAAHSLGTAIRKELHETYGYYSRHFPIAADQLFIIRACQGGASRAEADFVVGEVGSEGVSSVDRIGGATELFRILVMTGHSMFAQTILLLLRLLRA